MTLHENLSSFPVYFNSLKFKKIQNTLHAYNDIENSKAIIIHGKYKVTKLTRRRNGHGNVMATNFSTVREHTKHNNKHLTSDTLFSISSSEYCLVYSLANKNTLFDIYNYE